MSARPAISSSANALRVATSMAQLPYTVVSPATSSSAEASAKKIAMASSIPGSVSMITRLVATVPILPGSSRRDEGRPGRGPRLGAGQLPAGGHEVLAECGQGRVRVVATPQQRMRVDRRRVPHGDAAQVVLGGPQVTIPLADEGREGRGSGDLRELGLVAEDRACQVDREPER